MSCRLLLNASNMVFLELSIYNVLTAMSLLQLTARNAQSCTYPFSPTGRHVATTSALGTTMSAQAISAASWAYRLDLPPTHHANHQEFRTKPFFTTGILGGG